MGNSNVKQHLETAEKTGACQLCKLGLKEPTQVKSSTVHSHNVDPFHIDAMKVRNEIMTSALENRGQPQQILADKMVHQTVEVRVAVGTTETIKRGIRRQKAGLTPMNPKHLIDIPVPFPDTYRTNLIYDNESADNRILVFATDDGLGLLESATMWFMDGTHSTAPHVFEQVFTVRVPLGETSGTAAYALLPSMEQPVYEECLTGILDACLARNIRPMPTTVVCDYEIAIHNAVRQVLANDIQIQFPETLPKLAKNLRTLDLTDNKIAVIPSYIGTFVHLKTLTLNNNRIDTLPNEIGNLKKLETLSLENNILTKLVPSFKNLSHLRTVNLSGNGFKMFPVELYGLKNLDAIDLSRNRITDIAPSTQPCETIELNLNQNQISTLPETIADWPRLKVLRVEENCLEISALTPKIMKQSNIALLAIEGNVFDMKKFNNIDGYDEYMERFTATKKKFN